MKVKCRPEDFVVTEVAAVEAAESSGPYGLYVLEKRGWNTQDALRRIAAESGLPYRRFSYGGRKDRHALTRQYVTVKSQRDLTAESRGYSFRRIGSLGRPMGPDLVRGNRFRIVVRALAAPEAERLLENARRAERTGFPNYFDDQRFGSMDPERGFMAERLLKGHWRGALEIYLTTSRPEDPPAERRRRRRMREAWGDWAAMLQAAREGRRGVDPDMAALELLSAEPGAYVKALRLVPAEELSLFFSAYQAFIWNEVLRRLIVEAGLAALSHPGAAGPYLFYDEPPVPRLDYVKSLDMPLPASRAVFPDNTTAEIYARVLEERGIHPGRFNLRKLRQAFFKPSPRRAVVFPTELGAGRPEPDDLNPGRARITMSFFLPRGSYGTMLLKRLAASPMTPEETSLVRPAASGYNEGKPRITTCS